MKQNTLLRTRKNADQIVVLTGWMFAVLGALAAVITLFLFYFQPFIQGLWIENPDFPYIQSFFNKFFYILLTMEIFFGIGFLIGIGLIRKLKLIRIPFIVFNGAIIVGNVLTFWYAMHVHEEIKKFLLMLYLPLDSVKELILYMTVSDYFQVIFFSLVHVWLIWRYLQSDMKNVLDNCIEKKVEIEGGIH